MGESWQVPYICHYRQTFPSSFTASVGYILDLRSSHNPRTLFTINREDIHQPMLSLQECRKILGATAEKYSDEEILNIRDQLRELANLALEDYEREGSDINSCERSYTVTVVTSFHVGAPIPSKSDSMAYSLP
jgi:hypothetical protein